MKDLNVKSIQSKAAKARKLSLKAQEIARNERLELLNEIDEFVKDNWKVIWEGAEKHPEASLKPADYYTCANRIQFQGVRFSSGYVKIIDVDDERYHAHRSHHSVLSDKLLEHAVSVIQELLNTAATPITTKLKLVVE